jgi:polyisoprenoid-binding protein YceI
MKKAVYAAFMVAALGLTSCGGAEEVEVVEEVTASEYTINTEETKLEWKGSWVVPTEEGGQMEVSSHNGSISVTEGMVAVNGEEVTGSFTIDMSTIDNEDLADNADKKGDLEGHLMTPDFFNVSEYAKVNVMLNGVKDGMAMITVDIMGNKMDQTVPVSTEMNGDKMMMHGEFSMDFTALNWRMATPDPEKPEGGNVSPVVDFHLHAVLDKK